MVWFPNSWFYLSRRKCIVAMFSYFKKSEKKNLLREVYLLARCLMLNWSRRHAFIYAAKTWNLCFLLQFFERLCGKIFTKYSTGNEEWNEFETATITSDYVLHNHLSWAFHKLSCRQTNAHTPKKWTMLLFFFNSKRYRNFSQATILKPLLSNSSCVPQSISCY